VDARVRSGVWNSAGPRGRMVRSAVYVRVEEVSREERVEIRCVWSEGLLGLAKRVCRGLGGRAKSWV
jgi:hypothetical protein